MPFAECFGSRFLMETAFEDLDCETMLRDVDKVKQIDFDKWHEKTPSSIAALSDEASPATSKIKEKRKLTDMKKDKCRNDTAKRRRSDDCVENNVIDALDTSWSRSKDSDTVLDKSSNLGTIRETSRIVDSEPIKTQKAKHVNNKNTIEIQQPSNMEKNSRVRDSIPEAKRQLNSSEKSSKSNVKDGKEFKVEPKKVAMNSQVSETVKIEQDTNISSRVPNLDQNEQISKSATETQQKPKSTKSSQRNASHANSNNAVEPKSTEVGVKSNHCSNESTLLRNVSSSPDNSEVKKEVSLHETNASTCKVKSEVDPELDRNNSDKHILKSEDTNVPHPSPDNGKNVPESKTHPEEDEKESIKIDAGFISATTTSCTPQTEEVNEEKNKECISILDSDSEEEELEIIYPSSSNDAKQNSNTQSSSTSNGTNKQEEDQPTKGKTSSKENVIEIADSDSDSEQSNSIEIEDVEYLDRFSHFEDEEEEMKREEEKKKEMAKTEERKRKLEEKLSASENKRLKEMDERNEFLRKKVEAAQRKRLHEIMQERKRQKQKRIQEQSKSSSTPNFTFYKPSPWLNKIKKKGAPSLMDTSASRLEEQKRLFKQSAARVKAQEMAMRRVAERQGQLQFYKEVVNDVSTLPENHYKWSNFYSRLGVPDRAKFSDVKKNYRKLCLLYHPDKTGDQNDKILQDKFQGIKEAYERISESHGV